MLWLPFGFSIALSIVTGITQRSSCTFVMLCNEWNMATTKCNGHLTFQCVIDCWGTCLDAGMPGAIISCNLVATYSGVAMGARHLPPHHDKLTNIKLTHIPNTIIHCHAVLPCAPINSFLNSTMMSLQSLGVSPYSLHKILGT